MADVKISALPASTTPLAGTEVLPIVQSSTTKQVSVANLTAGRAVSASSLTLTTPLSAANGGTGLTSLTAGYIPYGNGTGAFGSSSSLYFSGSNLGIGTSSPVTKLDFGASVANVGQIISIYTAGNYRSGIGMDSATTCPRIYAAAGDPAVIIGNVSTANGSTFTEGARVTSAGDLLVGTTSNSAKLTVQGVSSQTCAELTGVAGKLLIDYLGAGNNYIDGAGTYFRTFSGTTLAVINTALTGTGNRAVYSTEYGEFTNSSSDLSLKTNITPIPYGLSDILKLLPIIFNWKNTAKMGEQKEIGFGAQDVQKVIPEVIGTNGDGTLSLDYPKLTAVLTKAIQELAAKVTALEAKQ